MDTLDILRQAEQTGGPEHGQQRREAMENILIKARSLNCELRIGGGRAGGMNIRYGSIGYSVLDVNTMGVVKLYVDPHPSKTASEAYINELNEFIEQYEQLKPKTFPINSYGHLDARVEEIEQEALELYLEKAVMMIRRFYYAPHYEEHELPLLQINYDI